MTAPIVFGPSGQGLAPLIQALQQRKQLGIQQQQLSQQQRELELKQKQELRQAKESEANIDLLKLQHEEQRLRIDALQEQVGARDEALSLLAGVVTSPNPQSALNDVIASTKNPAVVDQLLGILQNKSQTEQTIAGIGLTTAQTRTMEDTRPGQVALLNAQVDSERQRAVQLRATAANITQETKFQRDRRESSAVAGRAVGFLSIRNLLGNPDSISSMRRQVESNSPDPIAAIEAFDAAVDRASAIEETLANAELRGVVTDTFNDLMKSDALLRRGAAFSAIGGSNILAGAMAREAEDRAFIRQQDAQDFQIAMQPWQSAIALFGAEYEAWIGGRRFAEVDNRLEEYLENNPQPGRERLRTLVQEQTGAMASSLGMSEAQFNRLRRQVLVRADTLSSALVQELPPQQRQALQAIVRDIRSGVLTQEEAEARLLDAENGGPEIVALLQWELLREPAR